MTLTAFIPVYSIPKRAADIAAILAAENHPGARIVLVVDGKSNEAIDAALERVRDLPAVKILKGRPHLGKAEALNRAVLECRTEGLLFLDNDIMLNPEFPMFSACDAMLQRRDIAEIPKAGVGRGALAAMVKLEFLANIIVTDYMVTSTGCCPSMNGAAFMVRRRLFVELGGFRKTMNEDMDFAARAFFTGARFGFDPEMTVHNEVPETIPVWLKQRKRWAINSALWARNYMPRVKRELPEIAPQISASALIFPMPFIVALLGVALQFLPGPNHGVANVVGRIVTALMGVAGFASTALFFAYKARRFRAEFSLPGYLLFSALYLPVWAVFYISGILAVLGGSIPDLDWKHDEAANLAETEKPLPRRPRVARSAYRRGIYSGGNSDD